MKLTALQQELLLTWLSSHITPEQRQKLMYELPLVYNAFVDQNVVRVETNDLTAANINAVPHKRASARRVKP